MVALDIFRCQGRKVRAPEDSVMGNTHPANVMYAEDKSHRDEYPASGGGYETRQSLRGARSNRGRALIRRASRICGIPPAIKIAWREKVSGKLLEFRR